MSKPAHKSGTAGQWVNPDLKGCMRGIISDQAKKLSDVIDRVEKSEELDQRTKDYLEGYNEGFKAGYVAGKLNGASPRL